MKAQKILVTIISIILVGSLFAGTVSAFETASNNAETTANASTLQNVRDYAAASSENGNSYLVDAGNLYAATTSTSDSVAWTEVLMPTDVVAGVVATDSSTGNIYLGARNEMVLYRSQNDGRTWQRFALGSDGIGGIQSLAVDSAQKIVYVGTDTDGLYRLRDVGSSMTVNGHLTVNEPVIEIAADSAGAGLAFVRTATSLYRAENMGLSWVKVDNLGSYATAIAVTNIGSEFVPATVFVGTADRGLLQSVDGGYTWQLANSGLNFTPGSRLHVDALAVDPVQPQVLYVSTSYLFGSTTVNQTPAMVAVSSDNAVTWVSLGSDVADGAIVDDLMPVAGETGAVHALSTASRSPLAVGSAAEFASVAVDTTVSPIASLMASVQQNLAWLLATISALTLTVIAGIDYRNNRRDRKNGNAQAPAASDGLLGTLTTRLGF